MKAKSNGFLKRIRGSAKKQDLQHLPPGERDLILALADLRALAGEDTSGLLIATDHIRLSHRLAASVSGEVAQVLGLPPIVDLTLRTDAEGVVGSPGFRLKAEWFKNGQRQLPRRVGAMLETSGGLRRLPLWLLEAVEVAEGFKPGGGDIQDWGALSRFRQALDPGVLVGDAGYAARVSMTDFLSGLQVKVADCLSITPNLENTDFEVLPFSGQRIADDVEHGNVSESHSELDGDDLKVFQSRLRERGAAPAYRLGAGSFLVIDRAALPVLDVMSAMQRAPSEERAGFIRNPRPRITDAIEAALRKEGRLDNLSPEAEEEAIENVAGPVFVETREFSDRVTGIKTFEKPAFDAIEGSGTSWLPEQFVRQVVEALRKRTTAELQDLRSDVETAIERDQKDIPLDDISLPARQETLSTIDHHIAARTATREDDESTGETEIKRVGPLVLDGKRNIDQVEWLAKFGPRHATIPVAVPSAIRTPLKQHQIDSFEWQVAAWQAGLPGILNADEQGLGKTLQTIAFLVWLKSHMANSGAADRGPVLVVAPTSLLENWEQEVSRHVVEPGLGHLIRLYGSAISSRKLTGHKGLDIDSGEAKLDFGFLTEAIEEGRAHRFWVLTTYTTLTNYQHSLGRIPFSALVFDEIQTLKNHSSLRAQAALFMKADFRIGLTGTPIENSSVDLWAIMEQLASGAIGTGNEFVRRYRSANKDNMAELHDRVFKSVGGRPPLALRRTKDEVARDLPEKTRRLYLRLMPIGQASIYEDARLKLAQGGLGASLKMLHHIRSVSVHPSLDAKSANEDFISCSARLSATFDILRHVASLGEIKLCLAPLPPS